MTVIGVTTPDFHFFGSGDEVDFWEAIDLENTGWINRSVHWLFTVARLKPGVTLAQAQAAMDPIAQQLAQALSRDK
jgi:hypothetical protein